CRCGRGGGDDGFHPGRCQTGIVPGAPARSGRVSTLGLIAGGGELPRAVAFAARDAGRPVFVVPITGSASEDWVREFPHEFLSPGEPGRIIKALQGAGAGEVLLAG